MKLSELLDTVEEVELQIRKNFLSIDIIIVFSKHFGQRIIPSDSPDDHGHTRDSITSKELLQTFNKLKEHYKSIFIEATHFNDELKRGEFEGVIMDTFRKINIPFSLTFDKNKGKYILTCKTILKRENFYTKQTDHVIALRGK